MIRGIAWDWGPVEVTSRESGSGLIPPSRARHATPRHATPLRVVRTRRSSSHSIVLSSPVCLSHHPIAHDVLLTSRSRSIMRRPPARARAKLGRLNLKRLFRLHLCIRPHPVTLPARGILPLVYNYLVQRLRPSNYVRMGRYRMPLISDWSHKNPPARQTSWKDTHGVAFKLPNLIANSVP